MPLSLFELLYHPYSGKEILFSSIALWCVLTMTIGSVFNYLPMIPKATLSKSNLFCYPENLLKKDWQPLLYVPVTKLSSDISPFFFFFLLNLFIIPSILREIPSHKGTLNSSTVLNVRTKCIVMPVLKNTYVLLLKHVLVCNTSGSLYM